MNQTKNTWLRRGIAAVLAILLLAGIVLDVSAFATDGTNDVDNKIGLTVDELRSIDSASNPAGMEADNIPNANDKTAPTFAVDEDGDNSVRIKVGNNSLLFGNDFAARDDIKGLAFIAGNSIQMENNMKYGFVAGNTVKVSGAVQNDLFATGNLLSITDSAKIGGDVFAAGNELVVQANLPGDLAYTGNTLKIEGVTIQGNVNLSVDKVVFDSNTKINGSLTYNDTATIVGLANAEIQNVESYHIEEEENTLAREFYAKFLSMVGLFIVMLIFIFFMPRLHPEVERSATVQGTVIRMATGAWLLILIPVIAIFALCSVVGLPLSLIMIALYVIAIYLAQGFAGIWLGHLIIEKLAKSRANIYIEALVGIVLLGVLTLVPYIGGLVYFLSLLLGFGIIAHYFKPRKTNELNSSNTEGPDGKKKTDKNTLLAAKNEDNQTAKDAKSAKDNSKTAKTGQADKASKTDQANDRS